MPNEDKYTKGSEIIDEGKTKILLNMPNHPKLLWVENKDILTAFDHEKNNQQMENKAVFATNTTCRIFELLRKAKIPVAYKQAATSKSFITQKCQMIPLEIVLRRLAVGSFLDRRMQ